MGRTFYIDKEHCGIRRCLWLVQRVGGGGLCTRGVSFSLPGRSGSSEGKAKTAAPALGKKSHLFRVMYEVDERRQVVWVLHILQGARRKIKSADLG